VKHIQDTKHSPGDPHTPVYLRVTNHVCDRIWQKNWKEGDKLPSIRNLAIELEATPNAVARAYRWLSLREIINNRHRAGFFVSSDGIGAVFSMQREKFLFSSPTS
jgi:GntR family transcriptional regulator